ncbi:ABC transporter permease [Roseomonas sp. 18066]|uniref:ABC transporter permease n=1 Tax=Roseomonas sp. 18066 TaxID=2681412 RepID=UPI00135997D3|nr:ABC transporter permease [Roseomonas sp. 18066]
MFVARLLLSRALQAVVAALCIGCFSFVLMQMLPGDVAFRVAAARYSADLMSLQLAEAVRGTLGLDRPWPLRLLDWLRQVAALDFGRSLVSNRPVVLEVAEQLGRSLALAGAALAMTVALALPVGILAGLAPGRWFDSLSLLLATLCRSVPTYALCIVATAIFVLRLRWFPSAGFDGWSSLVLPAAVLSLGMAAVTSRVMRDSLARTEAAAFFRYGRHKGLPEWAVVWRHGLRNALIPVVAVLGQQTMVLIEGVVVVETLFSFPGIGQAIVRAVFSSDVPMIQATALALGLIFVLVNTVVDLLCLWLDPRARTAR